LLPSAAEAFIVSAAAIDDDDATTAPDIVDSASKRINTIEDVTIYGGDTSFSSSWSWGLRSVYDKFGRDIQTTAGVSLMFSSSFLSKRNRRSVSKTYGAENQRSTG
jgi:hypothetical protein